MAITHCIDSSCEVSTVLNDVSIPIQYCNGEMEIPGDGTVTGLLSALGGNIGSIGVTFIQSMLGFDVRTGNILQQIFKNNLLNSVGL